MTAAGRGLPHLQVEFRRIEVNGIRSRNVNIDRGRLPAGRNRHGHIAYRAAGDLVALDADDSLAVWGLDRCLRRERGLALRPDRSWH